MFINPQIGVQTPRIIDPDRPLIDSDFPRSAIFFGPPGTGKTTLVSGLADAIGWKYIEIHPSHFVSEGLPNVQQTADGIFGKLMEVDHAVILFDELDELVRERDIEPDQFGRFLTTSMLPRLAELWTARKVLYFVATNHIEYFDRAVTRSGRFDAVIFLSPPTFEAKKNRVLDVLSDKYRIKARFDPQLNQDEINRGMPERACKDAGEMKDCSERRQAFAGALPRENVLSKFALLRWDELDGIALQLSDLLQGSTKVTKDLLSESLRRLNDTKVRGLGEYCRFVSDPGNYERFDASKSALWIVSGIDGLDISADELPQSVQRINNIESLAMGIAPKNNVMTVKAAIGSYKNIKISGYTPRPIYSADLENMGVVELDKVAVPAGRRAPGFGRRTSPVKPKKAVTRPRTSK